MIARIRRAWDYAYYDDCCRRSLLDFWYWLVHGEWWK